MIKTAFSILFCFTFITLGASQYNPDEQVIEKSGSGAKDGVNYNWSVVRNPDGSGGSFQMTATYGNGSAQAQSSSYSYSSG